MKQPVLENSIPPLSLSSAQLCKKIGVISSLLLTLPFPSQQAANSNGLLKLYSRKKVADFSHSKQTNVPCLIGKVHSKKRHVFSAPSEKINLCGINLIFSRFTRRNSFLILSITSLARQIDSKCALTVGEFPLKGILQRGDPILILCYIKLNHYFLQEVLSF